MHVVADQTLLMVVKHFMLLKWSFLALSEEDRNYATSARLEMTISGILTFTLLWTAALKVMINSCFHSHLLSKSTTHPETSEKHRWCEHSTRSSACALQPRLPAHTGHQQPHMEGSQPALPPEEGRLRCPSNKGLPKLLSTEAWAASLLATHQQLILICIPEVFRGQQQV